MIGRKQSIWWYLYSHPSSLAHCNNATTSFTLASPLHTPRNPVRPVLNTRRRIRNPACNRPARAPRRTLQRLADTATQRPNNTTNRIRNTADRVANRRRDELDTGRHAGFLLADGHGGDPCRLASFAFESKERDRVTRGLSLRISKCRVWFLGRASWIRDDSVDVGVCVRLVFAGCYSGMVCLTSCSFKNGLNVLHPSSGVHPGPPEPFTNDGFSPSRELLNCASPAFCANVFASSPC